MVDIAPDSRVKLRRLLEQDEGFRQFSYTDTKGFLTIGYGFNLETEGLPRPVADFWLDYKIDDIYFELTKSLPVFNSLNNVRQIVLLNIAFNCGVDGLMQFRKMIEALLDHNYELAGQEILNSEINENRKQRLAYLMETGVL